MLGELPVHKMENEITRGISQQENLLCFPLVLFMRRTSFDPPKMENPPHFLLLWRILFVPSVWGEFSKNGALSEFLLRRANQWHMVVGQDQQDWHIQNVQTPVFRQHVFTFICAKYHLTWIWLSWHKFELWSSLIIYLNQKFIFI